MLMVKIMKTAAFRCVIAIAALLLVVFRMAAGLAVWALIRCVAGCFMACL